MNDSQHQRKLLREHGPFKHVFLYFSAETFYPARGGARGGGHFGAALERVSGHRGAPRAGGRAGRRHSLRSSGLVSFFTYLPCTSPGFDSSARVFFRDSIPPPPQRAAPAPAPAPAPGHPRSRPRRCAMCGAAVAAPRTRPSGAPPPRRG